MTPQTERIIIVGISIIVLGFLFYLAITLLELSNNNQEQNFLVVSIIDGDTFEIATGEQIRLICVDTPEKGQEGYQNATNFLSNLILEKEVRLEQDENGEDKDSYERLLRYVYLNTNQTEIGTELFINKEIIKQGYGTLFPYGNSTSKCNEIGGI